jgi:TIR domain
MGYVHPDKPDIFISYAHVDDEPDPAFSDRPGWVTTLVRCLEKRLAKKLGRVDSYDIWRDAKLPGHVDLTPDIIGHLRDAAVLLLVLSPAYLASEWCRRELELFHDALRGRKPARGRIFVVEFDRVDPKRKLPELADVKGYKLWVEDPDTRNPQTLGYPIVREKDDEYHKRVNDLCIELVRQLDALKHCEHPSLDSFAEPEPDTRRCVYLAEVTEDLDTRRDAVRRHLDQAGFRVLPEAELSRDDRDAYRDAVDAELTRSVVFVQLLSETPGRPFKGSALTYVALQHERATAVKTPVLQWRSRQQGAGSDESPLEHRQRLNGPTVVATDLSEFKSLVIDTLKKLTAPPPPAREPAAVGDAEKLVFVDAEETDLEAAREIVRVFEAHGIGALPPVRGTTPEAVRTALTTRMLACDGMVLVHGTNPDWPILQWTHFRKVKGEREVPIRAIALCDLPPPDRQIKAADVLHVPSAHVIDCCAGVAPDKFATFLRAL